MLNDVNEILSFLLGKHAPEEENDDFTYLFLGLAIFHVTLMPAGVESGCSTPAWRESSFLKPLAVKRLIWLRV